MPGSAHTVHWDFFMGVSMVIRKSFIHKINLHAPRITSRYCDILRHPMSFVSIAPKCKIILYQILRMALFAHFQSW